MLTFLLFIRNFALQNICIVLFYIGSSAFGKQGFRMFTFFTFIRHLSFNLNF